jgi:hypothetical protein
LSQPLKIQHVVVGEFPDGPVLRLTANRRFSLTQLDYLDQNGARVSSDDLSSNPRSSKPVDGKGQIIETPIDHAKLVQIHNLKPRSGYEAFPMQFRLHVTTDGGEETRTIPALLKSAFKQINNQTTQYMTLIG